MRLDVELRREVAHRLLVLLHPAAQGAALRA